MTRRVVVAGIAVLALVAALLVLRPAHPTPSGAHLTALRTAAGLDPCPSGLGGQLPDLRLDCLGGGPAVRLRGAAPGRPVLLNIWATWCGPCVREVPVLVDVARRAAGRVTVVGVDTEDVPAQALTFARQYAMHYASLVDPDGNVLRAYGAGPPITLLLDATGRVVFTHRGQLHSTRQVEDLLAAHLGVRL